MGLKSQVVGKKWEQEIMEYYFDRNYYVQKIPTQAQGTVYDIFVAKNGSCMFIEAKHTENTKLYFKSSGLEKKKDELNNFVKKTGNNVYLYIKSDVIGVYWTTWTKAKPVFEEKGYLELEKDCFKATMER